MRVRDERSLASACQSAHLNTDDNGLVEFQAPRDLGAGATSHSPLDWYTASYTGPYAELEAQGLSPLEVAERLGLRLSEGSGVAMRPALLRFLAGSDAGAEVVDSLSPPRPGPGAEGAAAPLVARRQWLRALAPPPPPTDHDPTQLLDESALLELDGVAALFAQAQLGRCDLVAQALGSATILAQPWALADHPPPVAATLSRSVAQALTLCHLDGGAPYVAASQTHAQRALSALLLREPPEAEEVLRFAPDHADAWQALARQRCQRGDQKGTQQALEALQRLRPRPEPTLDGHGCPALPWASLLEREK